MNYEKSSNIEHEENLTLFTFIQILATFGTKSVHSAGPSLLFFLSSFYSKIVEKLVSEVYCAFSDLFFLL